MHPEFVGIAAESDARLIERSRAGDTSAFACLVGRYESAACAVAFAAIGDRSLSEDAAQEAFLATWHKLGTLREPEKFRPWLLSAVRNFALMARRKARRIEVVAEEPEMVGGNVPLDTALASERERIVREALDSIANKYREPLVLFYREEQSVKQVAEVLELSEAAVKQRLSRGREALKGHLLHLVETELAESKPRKGFAAAVTGMILAGAAEAHATVAAPKSAMPHVKLASLVLGAVGLVIIAVALLKQLDRPNRGGVADRRSAQVTTRADLGKIHAESPTQISASSRLRGKVVDATTNHAIESARVCAQSRDELRCTETDERGLFSMENLGAGQWNVLVASPHHHQERDSKRASVFHLDGKEEREVLLALVAGGVHFTGVVEDVGGGPIAGADVFPGSPPYSGAPALTSANGTFELWVSPQDLYEFTATAEGYAQSRMLAVAGRTLSISLVPQAILSGRVVWADSQEPVASAAVSVQGKWAREKVYSDRDGRFALHRLSPGRYRPVAEAIGGRGSTDFSLALGIGEQSREVLIELQRVPSVRAAIRFENDEPCQHGTASLQGERFYNAQIDPHGNVLFPAVEAGPYVLAVSCKGASQIEAKQDILVDRDVSDILVRLEQGAPLSGTVIDANGAPVAGADVETDDCDQTISDAAGQFAFEHIGADCRVRAKSIDYLASDWHPAAGGPLTIVLDRKGGTLSGRVVDESGAPVADVEITVNPSDDGARTLTNDEGEFTLRHLPGGDYTVGANLQWNELWGVDIDASSSKRRRAKVRSGQTTHVQLVVEQPFGTIQGRLLDKEGQPIADAYITIAREDGRDRHKGLGIHALAELARFRRAPLIITGSDGTFTAEGLPPGTFSVLARASHGAEAIETGVSVGSKIELTLEPTGSLGGRVAFPSGDVPSQFEIEALRPTGGTTRWERFSSTNGQWQLHGLPPGSYAVRAWTNTRGHGLVQPVTVGAGEFRVDVDVELAERREVHAQIIDAKTREPIEGVFGYGSAALTHTLAVHPNPRAFENDWSNRAGKMVARELPIGLVNLFLYPMGSGDFHRPTVVQAQIPAGVGVFDLGVVEMPHYQLRVDAPVGDLGFVASLDFVPGKPDDMRMRVVEVQAGSEAASSGFRVGDVIAKVDGNDVSGSDVFMYESLVTVPPGSVVSVELERGLTVSLTAGPSL